MESFGTATKAAFLRLWRGNMPLTLTACSMLVALVASLLGLALDPREVLGAPVWLKPAKFAISIAVYCVTLAWLFSYLPSFARTRRVVGWVTAIAMLIEIGIITLQAARGTTSHFNVSSPLNGVLFTIMGVAIVLQTLSSIAVVVALFQQRFDDRALGWGLRLGLLLTIAGASIGGAMSRPSDEQLVELSTGYGSVAGAHTVGAPDGGPGLAVTGWSRAHGDLRVAHFMGLHALQVLPLLALGVRRTRRRVAQRVPLVLTFSASYAALVGIVLWQALRGESLVDPGPGTLAALAIWLAVTGGSIWRALAHAPVPGRATLSRPLRRRGLPATRGLGPGPVGS